MRQVGVQNITAVVSVTSQNRLFKFNKVTAPNGVFSLKIFFQILIHIK